ncbi:TPA: hypothetical protein ENS27_13680 [bacterium]|nr:hypothetical protein [bacterium]
MRCAVITKPLCVEITEAPKPEIEEGQILIKSHTVSICGSDMPYFLNERALQYPLPLGFPGHECIGTIVETRNKALKEGDYVLSIPNGDRGFAEYFVSHPSRTVSIPYLNNKFVIAQPLGTVIHACRKLFQSILPDAEKDKYSLERDKWNLTEKKVVIVGQGSIGLLFTAMMKLMNAETIIGIDLVNYRLDASQKIGATHIINCLESNISDMLYKITDGLMADLAIEAVGKDSTINDCFRLVKRSGVVLAFGVPRKSVYEFDFPDFFNREIKLIGSLGPDIQTEFPIAVELIANDKVDSSILISHILSIDDIQKAFEFVTEHKDNAIKILMNM